MILYTPMQLELVFDGLDQYNPINSYQHVNVGNAMLITEDDGYGGKKIVRLISTDPKDFLNPQYTPGSLI